MVQLSLMKSENKRQYIFVTGGVLSGVGKGITAASIGAILRARGLSVSIQKCDPYLNVDAGTLNPAEHGECFVTKDGAETDLDLGHYERFLDIELTQSSATLSGRLMLNLIEDERAGKFLGKTIQLVPHLTNAIQEAIAASGIGSEIHIVEIGGTVGDYEGLAYVEAIREFATRVGRENCLFVHVVYIPYIGASKEFKTKPAQNAIQELRGFGIVPDILVGRSDEPCPESVIAKLSMFGGVAPEAVVLLPNADTVYRVPLTLEEKGVGRLILQRFNLPVTAADMSDWQQLVASATAKHEVTVRVGIVAKYLDNEDTYFSVVEALRAAAWQEGVNLIYEWVSAEKLEKDGPKSLASYDGILLPGGFGSRGVSGKIAAADFAYKNAIPYLGLCLGLQMAVIASARRGGLADANTSEVEPDTASDVVYIIADQKGKESTGGTMRLGNYKAELLSGSLAELTYGAKEITERHRHRYEVNRKFEQNITAGGLVISGESPDGRLVEVVEGVNHPYYIATQAHPEFQSRPHRPHPLFRGFIKVAIAYKK